MLRFVFALLVAITLIVPGGVLAAPGYQHSFGEESGSRVAGAGGHGHVLASNAGHQVACEELPAGHCSEIGAARGQVLFSERHIWLRQKHWPAHEHSLDGVPIEAETPPPRT